MKGRIAAIIAFLLFIFIFTSGLFEGIFNFLTWLVTLNMTQSNISIAGEIFVKIAAWIISYTAVGMIFHALGWFDSDVMKFVYFVISTLVSFCPLLYRNAVGNLSTLYRHWFGFFACNRNRPCYCTLYQA